MGPPDNLIAVAAKLPPVAAVAVAVAAADIAAAGIAALLLRLLVLLRLLLVLLLLLLRRCRGYYILSQQVGAQFICLLLTAYIEDQIGSSVDPHSIQSESVQTKAS